MFTKRFLDHVFTVLILPILLCGCATINPFHRESLTDTAYVWVNQAAKLDVISARSDQAQIYIKFRAFLKDSEQNRVFFARAKWGEDALRKISLDKNVVLDMEFIDEERWEEKALSLADTVILSEHHWEALQQQLSKSITAEQPYQGSLVRYDFQELVYYHDEQGEIRITDYNYKPVNVVIKNSYDQTQFTHLIISTLKNYLKNADVKAERILLYVDQTYDDQQTFLYVDVPNALAVSLRSSPSDRSDYLLPVPNSLKSADQIILDGQVMGVATRPFSSAFRLYTWAKGSALHSIKPQRWVPPIFPAEPVPPLKQGSPMDLARFEEELDKIVGNTRTSGSVNFLIGGGEFFPALIESVQSAKSTIDLRTFIFDNDDYAVQIADLLKTKSRDKLVTVQVLLDGIGTLMGEGKIPDHLPAGFEPPASIVKYLKKNSRVRVRVRPNAWLKADHTKTIVIDEEVCYTGGMNIGREYRYDWHDMMMELRGPVVQEILHEFDIAWAHADKLGDLSYLFHRMKSRKPPSRMTGGIPIRPLYTRPDDPQIFKAQIAAIQHARSYIYISNAYFSDDNIITELIKARRRGVDVRVILPVNGNHEIMNKNNIVTANWMFDNGIKVYFYPGMSHIKAAVYDGWFCSGSANFDKLSFIDNLEFNIATSDPQTVQRAINELFEPDFKKSLLMTESLKSSLQDRIAKFLAGQL